MEIAFSPSILGAKGASFSAGCFILLMPCIPGNQAFPVFCLGCRSVCHTYKSNCSKGNMACSFVRDSCYGNSGAAVLVQLSVPGWNCLFSSRDKTEG